MGKSALQREMDSFLQQVRGDDFNIRHLTKSAFSQSRRQLNPGAFTELNDIVCRDFYQGAPYLGYNGHRVLAIDGTRLQLPKSKDIAAEFGEVGCGPKADAMRSMATVSFLYDVGNYLTLDVQVADKDGSEKSLAFKHMEKAAAGDLLLMDRGYPGIAMFSVLAAKGIHFCVRMKESWWLQVQAFSESSKLETEVVFEMSEKKYREYRETYPGIKKSVRCRLVKVLLGNGITEVLCTSLLDTEKYPKEEFKDVYHLRWGEEEGYKMFKARVGIEAFTGKTALSVKQDMHAKALMMSLCAALAFPIEQKVIAEYKNDTSCKYQQKINRTGAYAATRDIAVGLFIHKKINKAIEAFDQIVQATREIIRPGRSLPRKHKPKRPYHMNYKDI